MTQKVCFFQKSRIINYLNQLNQKHQKTYYSLLEHQKFLFFNTYRVLFYNQDDVNKLIYRVLHDLIENEFEMKILKWHFQMTNRDQIIVDLAVNNSGLLIGKFGQNQKTLEAFLTRVVSFNFRYKHKLTLQIDKTKNRSVSR